MGADSGESLSPLPDVLRVIGSVSPAQGGTTTVVIELDRQFESLGLRGQLLATDVDAGRARLDVPRGRPVPWNGVTVTFDRAHPPMRFKMSLGHARRVWSTSQSSQVIHVHGLYACSTIAAWVSSRRRRVPLIVQPHGVLEPFHQAKSRVVKGALDAVVGRRILRDSYAIVCASEAEAAEVRRLGYRQTLVIPHGVRLDGGTPGPGLSSRIEALGTTTVVLSLGRLARKKNPDLLLRAWAEASPKNAALLIVGPEEDWTVEQLRTLAAELGVADSVQVEASVHGADKTALLRRADLFVLPSNSENFGLSIPEALAAGTPCLVSQAAATSTYVTESGAGAVVADLEVTTWASAIVRLTDRPDELKEMGEAAADYSSNRFEWRTAAAGYLELYRQAAYETAKVAS